MTALDEARLALIARTLQIPPEVWTSTLAELPARLPPAPPNESADAELARCLPVIARVFAARSPHVASLPPDATETACPACTTGLARPHLARRGGDGAPLIVMARCQDCDHGVQIASGQAPASVYARADYYQHRSADGVGYDRYAGEAAYREAKGAALIARVGADVGPMRTLLEVGSGFGFTRAAAERAGIATTGVDVSAVACEASRQRTGLATFCGTLADAMTGPSPAVAPQSFDVVLYQFVLEHVADPAVEMARARQALCRGGHLVLLVPSYEAAELDVFGASYRSLRADHLHLMTAASLGALAARAGFAAPRIESHCNLHLLRGCVSEAALQRIYETGRGPDLFVTMRRRS